MPYHGLAFPRSKIYCDGNNPNGAKMDLQIEPTQQELVDFRSFVDHLFQAKNTGPDAFLHAAVGLTGESAEILDHMKKHWVYERPLDTAKVLEEMGDAFHYFTMMLIVTGWTLKDVIDNNVAKLNKRYPNGFTKADAIARADKGPARAG